MLFLHITCFSLINLTFFEAAAETKESSKSSAQTQKSISFPTHNTFFDKTQRTVSKNFLALSRGIDSFFGDETSLNEGNDSQALVTLSHTISETTKPELLAKVRIKLRLPRTKNKLNLVVDNISDNFRNDQVAESQVDRVSEENQENDLTTALRYSVIADEKWDVNTNAGIKIKIPLDPFLSLRARRNFYYNEWKLGLTQNIFWFNSLGLGEVSRADLEHPILQNALFRFSNSASWLKEEDFFRFNHNLTLYQPLTPRSAFSLSAGISSLSEPEIHIESYSLSAAFRLNILRRWFFFEVIPGITYPEERNFSSVYSVIFKFESAFGHFEDDGAT